MESLDLIVDKRTKATATAIDHHNPELRPSPYSKRWFTVDLKSQQKDVNRSRRKWQESCANFGRDDPRTMKIFDDMRKAKGMDTNDRESQDIALETVPQRSRQREAWKVATYMKPLSNKYWISFEVFH
jgi:hypothetical protein